MTAAISKKSRIDYVADFETTTDPLDCRVWGWGIVGVQTPEYENVELGHELSEFIDRVSQHNANVYFHNLKFDGTFIIDWLLRNEYVYTSSKFKIMPGEFKALIDRMGKFYSITVLFQNGKTVEFRDSAKKFPGFSVAKIAKAFKLGDVKGDIDYDAPRPVGHIMTDEERDYLRRDVTIVAQALKFQMDEGMHKLTVASDSMAEFKSLFGVKRFQRVFPVLSDAMDQEIRMSYRGGFTYKDERRQGVQGEGIVLDVNSLYPSVMFNDLLPYGEPRYMGGQFVPTETFPLGIMSVTFTARLKKRHIPCIQIKGNTIYGNTEYLKKIDDPVTLWVTNVDWELWNDHYDIEVYAYNGAWAFRGAQGLFDDYINKWMEVKARSVGGRREIAKLHLNSLYGKFASNPDVTGKYPVLENDHVAFKIGEEERRAPVYTAMGSFITAYARRLTITAAQDNYDTFAYADTDSLHLLRRDTPTTLDVHPTKLGAWKFEYAFQEALYVRAKFYLERKSDGTYVNRAAGIPESVSELLTFDDVFHGNVIGREWVQARTGDPRRSAKLQPHNVHGGVVLRDTDWTINI
ncbi:DNA polymerase [Curtobacterium phage Reje]|uniref:DNA polymerase n=1 Tax=Curtobacterium phage Reje TaxID=2851069 RepID=UPI0021FACCC2|nr:DNA polymerase [Curtobacterium phage Reje]QXG07811.1 DNA polymerase [Curtobacterium phage Reje]